MKNIGILLFSIFVLSASPVWSESGEQILEKVDEQLVGAKAPKDMEAVLALTIVSAKGREKHREIKAWTKNIAGQDSWRILKFISPPDVENIGFLVLSEDQMYLYLPEFRRIRRIASHNKKESFMGSDFSYEDMGTSGFVSSFNAVLVNEDSETWILELEQKPGSKKPYPKIKMWVAKESGIPVKMEMYNASEQLVKEAEQESKKIGDYWVLNKITMKDVKKKTHSVLEMKDIKVDQNLDDAIFTQRYLQRSLK